MSEFALSQPLLSSAEAAARLSVAPARVRAMIRDGILDARKLGGRWVVDPGSVERRRAAEIGEGRPFEPANAWALIDLWHGGDAPWVSRSERSRLRRRLRERGIRKLVPALRGRAELWRLRGHPAALDRLHDEPGLRLGGVSAAPIYNADIRAPDEHEAYMSAEHADAVLHKYRLEHAVDPNILLHVVEGPWPFLSDLENARANAVPPLVVALDLLESPGQRSRRAGEELLDRLRDDRSIGALGEPPAPQ